MDAPRNGGTGQLSDAILLAQTEARTRCTSPVRPKCTSSASTAVPSYYTSRGADPEGFSEYFPSRPGSPEEGCDFPILSDVYSRPVRSIRSPPGVYVEDQRKAINTQTGEIAAQIAYARLGLDCRSIPQKKPTGLGCRRPNTARIVQHKPVEPPGKPPESHYRRPNTAPHCGKLRHTENIAKGGADFGRDTNAGQAATNCTTNAAKQIQFGKDVAPTAESPCEVNSILATNCQGHDDSPRLQKPLAEEQSARFETDALENFRTALQQMRRKAAWDPEFWLYLRDQVLQIGRSDLLVHLQRVAVEKTERTVQERAWWIQGKGRMWQHEYRVDLTDWMLKVPEFKWFSGQNTNGRPGSTGTQRCLDVTEDSAIDIAQKLRCSNRSDPIVVVADISAFDANGDPDLSSPFGALSPEDLHIRTDILRFIRAVCEQRRLCNFQSSVRDLLCNPTDPHVIRCPNVQILRGGAELGYPFLEEPVEFTAILTSSLCGFEIRSVRVGKRTPMEWFADRGQGNDLIQRLSLLGMLMNQESILRCKREETLEDDQDHKPQATGTIEDGPTHGADPESEETDERYPPPFVVMGVPGNGGSFRLPRDAVANALKHWRRQFAANFRHCFLCCRGRACGDAEEASYMDRVVNRTNKAEAIAFALDECAWNHWGEETKKGEKINLSRWQVGVVDLRTFEGNFPGWEETDHEKTLRVKELLKARVEDRIDGQQEKRQYQQNSRISPRNHVVEATKDGRPEGLEQEAPFKTVAEDTCENSFGICEDYQQRVESAKDKIKKRSSLFQRKIEELKMTTTLDIACSVQETLDTTNVNIGIFRRAPTNSIEKASLNDRRTPAEKRSSICLFEETRDMLLSRRQSTEIEKGLDAKPGTMSFSSVSNDFPCKTRVAGRRATLVQSNGASGRRATLVQSNGASGMRPTLVESNGAPAPSSTGRRKLSVVQAACVDVFGSSTPSAGDAERHLPSRWDKDQRLVTEIAEEESSLSDGNSFEHGHNGRFDEEVDEQDQFTKDKNEKTDMQKGAITPMNRHKYSVASIVQSVHKRPHLGSKCMRQSVEDNMDLNMGNFAVPTREAHKKKMKLHELEKSALAMAGEVAAKLSAAQAN